MSYDYKGEDNPNWFVYLREILLAPFLVLYRLRKEVEVKKCEL